MLRRRLLIAMQKAQIVWRTVVKTGAGLIVANDTTEGQPVDLQLQGWTEQEQYDGKNLFDISKISTTWNGTYGITNNNDGTLSIAHKAGDSRILTNETLKEICPNMVAGNTYFLSFTTTGFAAYIYVNGSGWNNGRTRIITEDDLNSTVAFYTGLSEFELCSIKDVMINEGSTAIPYEPYTGDQPSPSPEYSQEIVNAGKYNEETGRYEVEMKLSGKNLWNPENEYVSGTYRGWLIDTSLIGEGNSIALYDKGNGADISGVHFGFTGSGLDASLGAVWLISNGSITTDFRCETFGSTKSKYISIYPNTDEILQKLLNRFDVLVSHEKEKPLIFEPYKEPQTVKATSERPIKKWDRLVEKDGVIGWDYKSGSITFDGSDDESWFLYGSKIKTFAIDVSGFKFNYSFCDKYRYGASAWASNKYGIYSDNGYATKYFRPPYEGFEISVDVWKGLLKETPLTVICESSESKFVPLPTEEQESLRALKTYYPTTVFSNDNAMFMQVEYQTKVPEQEV